ncbi:uncharacterized protein LOC124413343 [Diprion similis]|uniref:uncharacterized protein LOC124413343 n=1 Tax=Diprion similis TaxID=362088 RepID=UPI001EF8F6B0|nr:uncharacterized protein LOC124413343 [Diprion similis]
MREYVVIHPLTAATATSEVLNPRDAFYGGRTGNTSRYYEVKTDAAGIACEEIRYVDVCSLYLFICKNGWFPVGHPTIYVGEECKLLTGARGCDITRVEGLIKCRVLPPRNLYHPALPSLRQGECRHDDEAAQEFEGTWVSVELKKAVEMGYKIKSIREIWQYMVTSFDPTTRQGGHFADYIDTFLKIKQEASGWPAECEDESAQMRYLDEYERVEEPGKNGGYQDATAAARVLTNPEVEVSGLLPVNDDARLKLYSYLEKLDRRVLYYDTDSVIYTRNHHRPNAYEPPTGNFLGDLTDELEPYGRVSFIRAFVSGGPKFYAFIVKRPNGEEVEICKVKDITLNHTASSKINFEAIKGMVVEAAAPINLEYRAIRRTELHAVVTRSECKTCKPVFAKRRCCVDSFDTLPYGYRAG